MFVGYLFALRGLIMISHVVAVDGSLLTVSFNFYSRS